MKLLRFCLFFSLLFTQCFGMGFFFDEECRERPIYHPNPLVSDILERIKTKNLSSSLQPEEFWAMMETSTGMGSCFLGEFIAASKEDDVCLVFEYIIRFGTINKAKFHECMSSCLGIDGITPLNELIYRMPEIPIEGSSIIQVFYELLDLIKTLEPQKRLELLNQEDIYRPCPVITANRLNKIYIVNAIADVIVPDQATQIPGE